MVTHCKNYSNEGHGQLHPKKDSVGDAKTYLWSDDFCDQIILANIELVIQ